MKEMNGIARAIRGAPSGRQSRPAAASGAAECFEDAFAFSWRIGVVFETLLILIRPRQDLQKLRKRCKILSHDCGFERLFDAVIARDEGGIDASHDASAFVRIDPFAPHARSPAFRPCVIGVRGREQGADACVRLLVLGERAERDESSPGFFVPHYLVTLMGKIAEAPGALKDATPVLMHAVTGLRSVIDADQIALHEWGAARASAAVWRIVGGTRLGMSELEATSN